MNGAEPIDWPASVAATRRLSRTGHVPHPGCAPASLVSSGDSEAQVAEFTAACELVGGQVHHIANAADVATFVASLCAPPLDPRVLAWAPEHLPLTGVHDAMLAHDLELLSDIVRTDAAG